MLNLKLRFHEHQAASKICDRKDAACNSKSNFNRYVMDFRNLMCRDFVNPDWFIRLLNHNVSCFWCKFILFTEKISGAKMAPPLKPSHGPWLSSTCVTILAPLSKMDPFSSKNGFWHPTCHTALLVVPQEKTAPPSKEAYFPKRLRAVLAPFFLSVINFKMGIVPNFWNSFFRGFFPSEENKQSCYLKVNIVTM